MKNALSWFLAIVIAYVLWHILLPLIAGIAGLILWIGLIVVFCYLVGVIYRLLTRSKQLR